MYFLSCSYNFSSIYFWFLKLYVWKAWIVVLKLYISQLILSFTEHALKHQKRIKINNTFYLDAKVIMVNIDQLQFELFIVIYL